MLLLLDGGWTTKSPADGNKSLSLPLSMHYALLNIQYSKFNLTTHSITESLKTNFSIRPQYLSNDTPPPLVETVEETNEEKAAVGSFLKCYICGLTYTEEKGFMAHMRFHLFKHRLAINL